MNKIVSIIIATYNQSDKISETLDSLVCQTYKYWECIVVDDKSTDETAKIVKNYSKNEKRIKYYLSPKEILKGPNGARNYGISKSIGFYIMSLDSDDLLDKEHLEKKILIFKKNDVNGVLSKTILIDDNLNEISREKRTFISNNLIEDFITLKISWYMHDIMWKRDFLNNKSLYDINLLKMLDRDFHIRMLSYFPKLYLLDEYLSFYRIYPNSNSTNMSIKVAETRHNAVLKLLEILKNKNLITNKIKGYYLKFQIQNIVVLYKHKKCFKMYVVLIKKSFVFNFYSIKWIFKLFLAYFSYKITNRGLLFIKE